MLGVSWVEVACPVSGLRCRGSLGLRDGGSLVMLGVSWVEVACPAIGVSGVEEA